MNAFDFVIQKDCDSQPVQGLHNTNWNITDDGTDAATISKAAVADTSHVITGFIASSDKAGAICLVKVGATVVVQSLLAANTPLVSPPLMIAAGANTAVSIEIDGTLACNVNLFGFSIKRAE